MMIAIPYLLALNVLFPFQAYAQTEAVAKLHVRTPPKDHNGNKLPGPSMPQIPLTVVRTPSKDHNGKKIPGLSMPQIPLTVTRKPIYFGSISKANMDLRNPGFQPSKLVTSQPSKDGRGAALKVKDLSPQDIIDRFSGVTSEDSHGVSSAVGPPTGDSGKRKRKQPDSPSKERAAIKAFLAESFPPRQRPSPPTGLPQSRANPPPRSFHKIEGFFRMGPKASPKSPDSSDRRTHGSAASQAADAGTEEVKRMWEHWRDEP